MNTVRRIGTWMLSVAAIVLADNASSAQAQQYSSAEMMRRIQALESELQQRTWDANYTSSSSDEASYSEFDGCCDDSCYSNSGWVAEADVLFLRFGDNDGTPGDYNFEASPRFTVGYVGCSGLGLRARSWFFDENLDGGAAGSDSIDTYNLDLELFKEIQLPCSTRMEIGLGLRYNDFDWVQLNGAGAPTDHNVFSAVGVLLGLQLNHDTRYGSFYGRFRWASLMGDHRHTVSLVTAQNAVHSQTEVAIGYEGRRCLSSGATLVGRVGGEWWQWNDMDLNNDTDIGFAGFVVGLGVVY